MKTLLRLAGLLTVAAALMGCAVQASPAQEPMVEAPPSAVAPSPTTEADLPVLLPVTPRQPSDPLLLRLDHMSTEELVGQLFLVRCPTGDAVNAIAQYHLGGLVLFARDFEGQIPDSIRQTLESYQAAASLPLLVAVDEEGGTVCRASCVPAFRDSPFLAPRDYYAQGGMEAVLAAEVEKCIFLKELGINVNLAPVCDIAESPGDFMYRRSLGQSSEVTAQFIAETVQIMSLHQVGSTLKHFPGYGSNTDTHYGMARDKRNLDSLVQRDLIPFQAGIDAGCGAIMVSHTIVDAFDSHNPATLSPEVHRYLRQEMGYDGVILTDDLAMEAITDCYGTGEAAVLAVLAGNDLLCCTDYPEQYTAVLEAVQSGRIPRELLEEAVLRILRWKQDLGLI